MGTKALDILDQDLTAALRQLAENVLALAGIDAILVPSRSALGSMVMPTLVSNPAQLADMDALAPAFAVNAAQAVARLTRKPSGYRLAVLLRPCEIRAFIELVKLNQGALEEIVVIGIDCLGAMGNTNYLTFAAGDGAAATRHFYQQMLNHPDQAFTELPLTPACRSCDQPFAQGSDLAIWLWGVDTRQRLLVHAQTDRGKEVLAKLPYPDGQIPAERDARIAALLRQRAGYRDQMFERTRAATNSLEKLTTYFNACVNCYNCRVACPVCYCRECVFVTDVFQHEPFQYITWSRRKGAYKLPGETLFYHLTRLAHMSTACVGCGQCSNACPNDIPVMELFSLIARQTQAAFDYRAGADVAQKPPLTEFREVEFNEVVGLADAQKKIPENSNR